MSRGIYDLLWFQCVPWCLLCVNFFLPKSKIKPFFNFFKIGGENGNRHHFQKVLSNYCDNGPTIDLWIKLKIYLENRCSGHEMEPSMVKFCPLVLLLR